MNHLAIRRAVAERDSSLCIIDGRPAAAIHHIAPRSWFGKRNESECWQPKNMCCLCATCHNDDAHTKHGRAWLLAIMQARYGYGYDDMPWRGMLSDEADSAN